MKTLYQYYSSTGYAYDADISLEDSGNYTCEINGPLNSLLGSVTHYLFVRGRLY